MVPYFFGNLIVTACDVEKQSDRVISCYFEKCQIVCTVLLLFSFFVFYSIMLSTDCFQC